MASETDITSLELRLNEMILSGRALEAFELYYDDQVVMEENTASPTAGKVANRQREHGFHEAIAEIHSKLLGSAVAESLSYSEWEYEIAFKNGSRWKIVEMVARRWKSGRIVHERYYHENFPPR